MGGIGGVYARNGSALDGQVLRKLGSALAEIGPDGQHFLVQPPVGMVFCAFHTDSESRRTRQPVATPQGGALVWNGRLDNRKDLERDLADDLPPAPREIDFVLAAYRAWGIEGFSRLIGDFSLALWDPAERLLVLACDAFSVRPLYFAQAGDLLVWSSRARAVLTAAGLSPDVDEEFVAGFLTSSEPSDHSPFRTVRMLPPGCALAVRGERIEMKRIWRPDPRREIRYRSDDQYEEHFRMLFREAVSCRLRSDGPVYADLSGGLDSSSIVCVADEILAAGAAEAPELRTVSWVYDQSKSSDERVFIRPVEEKRGRPGLHIRDEEHPMLSRIPASYRPDYPHCQLAFLARNDFLAASMARAGARVLLRGTAGDQVLWGGMGLVPIELADLLKRGRLGKAMRSSFAWSHAARRPWHSVFWRGGIAPLLPLALTSRFQSDYPLERWFEPSFARRLRLKERVVGVKDDVGFRLPSARRRYILIREVSRDIGWEFFTTAGCVDMRFPFMDRRLVEFALALDVSQWLRPGETKSLLRRALAGTLPEKIRLRRSKAGPDEALYRACLREWSWLSGYLADARVCDLGFVSRAVLKETLQQMRHGVKVTTPQLLRTLCLELWLRSLEGRHESERLPDKPATNLVATLPKGVGNG
ncbi:MAG TPA: asparagine synthase-related protein [Thermoanaerobaculia bacterium]|nr:asparagine synthase-related protein [Thermoanaerobaculia bacterium]